MVELNSSTADTLFYYSYGINMFKYMIKNLTAEFVCIGRLDNYRLDFTSYSKFWRGAIETIVPTANAQVWGVIWRVRKDDMTTLDKQHKIQTNLYSVNYIDILTSHMGDISCRVYIQTDNPLPRGDNDAVPMEKWPSWSYKEVMIIGALEHNLPDHYILYLEGIKDNGDRGFFRTYSLLTRNGADAPCVCDVYGGFRDARSLLQNYEMGTKNQHYVDK